MVAWHLQQLNLVGDGLLNGFQHPSDRHDFVLSLAQRVYKQNELFLARHLVQTSISEQT